MRLGKCIEGMKSKAGRVREEGGKFCDMSAQNWGIFGWDELRLACRYSVAG
jgi:hypothetical protein